MPASRPESAMAALVRRCLDANNLRQADLARKLGISESALSTLIHRPKKSLPVETIGKLARGLGVHTAEVLSAYMADAGEPVESMALDGPETAIVVGAMRNMPAQRKKQLARIARDFLDDEK